ncbi:MAG: AMP-binding protein [Actinomycetota bacterium]|nr:AMP-binding protein [Actinomycetota bacterium]
MHSDPPTSCPSLVDLLRWRGEHQPGRRAFTFLRDGEGDEVPVSYGALNRGAQRVAALLQRETREGDRALLLYPSGLEYITAFLGCLYAAVIAVPAYPPNPRLERTLGRLRTIVQDAGPAVVLTTTSILPIGSQLAGREPAFAGIRWLATDTDGDAGAEAWHEPATGGAGLAFLQYTSGSTTAPRGVMVSHQNLMHNQALIQRVAALDADSIGVSWLPMYHDMGLIGAVLQPIYTGFPCVLMSPAHFLQDPVRWLRAISRYRATVSAGPNFAYDLCNGQIKPDELAGLDLSSWRVALNGAEPIWPATLDSFTAAFGPYGLRREALTPCYGLAEATLLVSGGPAAASPAVIYAGKLALRQRQLTILRGPDSGRTSALVGSGQVQPGERVLVVDPQTRVPCQPGLVGEIWVAGASVAQGYWNSPEATEEIFRARLADGEGPFLRTGDLGFIHDGQLFVSSRLKDLIIIRGSNHAPQDIERTAQASHPALRPGCGIAFAIEAGGDPQLAIVHEVRRERSSVDCEEVASAIRQVVAEEHGLDVHAVVLVRHGTVPRTSSGKLQRQACREQFLDGTLRQTGQSIRPVRSRTGPDDEGTGNVVLALMEAGQAQRLPLLVRYLRQRSAAAAGIPPEAADADQPFTALGLDSLRLLQLKQRIETDLAVTVPLESFMDYPTAAALAASLLGALEDNVGAVWAEVAGLTDEEIDARLAEFTAKEARDGNA